MYSTLKSPVEDTLEDEDSDEDEAEELLDSERDDPELEELEELEFREELLEELELTELVVLELDDDFDDKLWLEAVDLEDPLEVDKVLPLELLSV